MEHEEHEKRLQAQAEANAKAHSERLKRRKTKKSPQIASSIINNPIGDQVDADAVNLPSAVSVASDSVPDPHVDASPKQPTKRLKVVHSSSIGCLPEQTPVYASSSSVTLGHTLSSMIPISSEDPDILGMDSAACGVQSTAHATQTLLWIIEQSKKSLEESKYREKLIKDAVDRVAEEQKKVADIKNLKQQLKDANKEKDELRKSLADKEKECAVAVEARLAAETYWYGKGKMARLAMVRDAGLPYMKCLSSWERQMGDPFATQNDAPIEEEEDAAIDANNKNDSPGTGDN